MKKIDPKTINVPNICFSICEDDTERGKLYRKQRLERGFDDSETWNLDCTIAQFILPRLKRFKEVLISHPMNITATEWNNILDKMIFAWEYLASDDEFKDVSDIDKKVEMGLTLFAKYYQNLWW